MSFEFKTDFEMFSDYSSTYIRHSVILDMPGVNRRVELYAFSMTLYASSPDNLIEDIEDFKKGCFTDWDALDVYISNNPKDHYALLLKKYGNDEAVKVFHKATKHTNAHNIYNNMDKIISCSYKDLLYKLLEWEDFEEAYNWYNTITDHESCDMIKTFIMQDSIYPPDAILTAEALEN